MYYTVLHCTVIVYALDIVVTYIAFSFECELNPIVSHADLSVGHSR
jgi:hypothetical protein